MVNHAVLTSNLTLKIMEALHKLSSSKPPEGSTSMYLHPHLEVVHLVPLNICGLQNPVEVSER